MGRTVSPESAQSSGRTVIADRYRIIGELGRGGFGQTYLVEDLNRFDERCVLKEFAPAVDDDDALEKAQELFTREAKVLYNLKHPQIPRFREWFTESMGRSLFLVQDYVAGQTYQALLRERQHQGIAFTISEVMSFLTHLLPVLDYIHGRGVVHRDISPDNLICRDTDQRPVLIDFGGVKQMTASLGHFEPQSGSANPYGGITLLGKPGYAPEEQIRLGQVSSQSDLYALGVTALVLLMGQDPQEFFDPNTRTFCWQDQIQPSPDFAAVIEKLVAAQPARRYASANQVLVDLESIDLPSESDGLPSQSVNPALFNGGATVESSVVPNSRSDLTEQTLFAYVSSAPTGVMTRLSHHLSAAVATLLKGVLTLGAIAGVGSLGVWWIHDWLQTHPFVVPAPEISEPPAQPFSQAEQERKARLFERIERLQMPRVMFNRLTNEAYFLEYPDQQGKVLTAKPEDAQLRANWDAIAFQVAEVLERLSPQIRARLGQYSQTDRTNWDTQLRKAKINRRRFYRAVEKQFRAQLPMYRSVELQNKVGLQIWYALAAERLQRVKAE